MIKKNIRQFASKVSADNVQDIVYSKKGHDIVNWRALRLCSDTMTGIMSFPIDVDIYILQPGLYPVVKKQ